MDTKTRPLYMLSTRDPPQNKGYIQTESKGLEKDISCKWRPKESRSHIYFPTTQEYNKRIISPNIQRTPEN